MKRMSGQYSLVNPGGVGGRPKPGGGPPDMPDMPSSDAYRSPFLPGGHAGFVWSERAVPLAHILKDNTLPLVVKISAEASVRTEGESSMDFRQPFLLYREHLVSRLYARNLTASGTGRKEVGPYVVIPQNYPGFFRPTDHPAKPVTTMSTMARFMPSAMLSTSPCEGYLCVSPLDSDVTYQKTSLEPGHYFIKDLLEDEITLVQGGGQKGKRKKLVRCLRCVNETGKGVLFPLKTSGQFLVAGHVDSGGNSRHQGLDNACRVYRWTELTMMGSGHNGVGPSAGAADGGRDGGGGDGGRDGGGGGGTKNNLNDKNGDEVVADLIHGKPPPQECNFTGTLAFKHVTHDHTVIGCTTSEEKPRLFEMSPASKGPSFVLALNQDCFDSNGPLEHCLKFAKQEMDRYVSEMKVRRDFEVESKELRESSS